MGSAYGNTYLSCRWLILFIPHPTPQLQPIYSGSRVSNGICRDGPYFRYIYLFSNRKHNFLFYCSEKESTEDFLQDSLQL